jgi:anaphase-promoting complex subunit 6
MDISGIHLATVPLHVACMYHLKHLHSRLFLLAHELVDKEPESPTSWYTVGIWYLATTAWREAKQHLSKTTIMDSRHAPGWIAFAHTFAKEGEHEHAITAYSTCARLFKGCVESNYRVLTNRFQTA